MRWHDERIRNNAGNLGGGFVYTKLLERVIEPMRDDYEQALLNQRAESIKLAQRVVELEAQLSAALATIERACGAESGDGRVYAEGCAP